MLVRGDCIFVWVLQRQPKLPTGCPFTSVVPTLCNKCLLLKLWLCVRAKGKSTSYRCLLLKLWLCVRAKGNSTCYRCLLLKLWLCVRAKGKCLLLKLWCTHCANSHTLTHISSMSVHDSVSNKADTQANMRSCTGLMLPWAKCSEICGQI